MKNNTKECHITKSEWQIMKVVWANGEVTSKFVADVLCEKMEWKKTTLKTLLNRLLEKEILQKREIGNKYIYFTKFSENEITEKAVMEPFDKICKTKVGKFVGKVIENSTLSFDDLKLIQKIIDEKVKTAVNQVTCDCLEGQCNCSQHKNNKNCCENIEKSNRLV